MENKKEKKTEITKYNAVKHGILRESTTLYESSDYVAFYDELERDMKPKNSIERLLLERIVVNKIKLDRISKAESELVKQNIDPRIVIPMVNFEWDTVKQEGYSPKMNFEAISKLDLYSRYETQAENRMYKAIQVLQSLKF